MIIFLLLILFFFLLIFIIDAIPQFYTWQSRIKIGRFSDENIWKEKVLEKSIFWLNHLPKLKIKDQERLILIDMLKGEYHRNALQSWQEASLLLGLNNMLKITQNADVKTEISKFLKNKLNESGNYKKSPQEVDVALLSYAILETGFLSDDQERNLSQETFGLIKKHLHEDGTIAYRNFIANYRLVDTVGFVCPFLVKYGVKYNVDSAIDLAVFQIKNYEKYGMLENRIPVHAYELDSKNPVGIFGWGRGLAWFLIGITETLKNLPDHHPEKNNLENLQKKISVNLLKFQKEDGSFSWNLYNESAQKDSSATAVFAWFLKEMNFPKESKKALDYLKSVTRRTGEIDFSQGDTKSIGVYSQNFEILPFTQGFTLRNFY